MHDIINDITTWSILKWVIIVLVAGFIGQFGKSMAQSIIAKIRLVRAKKQDAGIPQPTLPEAETSDPVKNNFHEVPAVNIGSTDKKNLKTLSKQEKKAAKLAKKGN